MIDIWQLCSWELNSLENKTRAKNFLNMPFRVFLSEILRSMLNHFEKDMFLKRFDDNRCIIY